MKLVRRKEPVNMLHFASKAQAERTRGLRLIIRSFDHADVFADADVYAFSPVVRV